MTAARRAAVLGWSALCLAAGSAGQSIPFLPDDRIRMLANEFSGDRAYEHIRVLSRWHRDSGMEGFFKAAEYIMQAAKDAGLEDVRFVEQTMDRANYTAVSGVLRMVEPVEVKLADIGESAVALADGSHSADVTAELVWIGDASDEALEGVPVAGKIVLTSGSANTAVRKAVWDRGAAGVVSFATSEGRNPLDVPDQTAWSRITMDPPEGKKGAFAFILPPRKGELLRDLLKARGAQDLFATGKRTPGGRAVLNASVRTVIGRAPGRTGFVEGWIRGSSIHDRQVVVTAHLQEEKSSANDDGSGCANILEIGRALHALIAGGRMSRPQRDIRFWWTDEISSEYRFFQDNPDEPKKFLANVHQDMVGANQAMGSRVQHMIFAPHSRTSFVDAVFEDIGTYLIQTNNGFLAASRAGGLPRPFTRPLFSARGTRDGYNARFVPYFNSSDHMCFVEGIIGVPAVATINWDDPYIHSSDDDLPLIDPTQLLRNQFLMGATAAVLATAGEPELPILASETYSQGTRRLAGDLQAGLRVLHESAGQPGGGWQDATLLVEQGIQRELRALHSLRALLPDRDAPSPLIERYAAGMRGMEKGLTSGLTACFLTLHGREPIPVEPDSAALAAALRVPANAGDLRTYFTNRDKGRGAGSLHTLMRDEAFNFVDGTRSYFDIYKAVRAEQLAAGSWYYGAVSLQDVAGLLDAAVQSRALVLKK